MGFVLGFERGPEAVSDAASDCAVIGVREDDAGTFPAQFKRDALQSFGGCPGDSLACPRGAGERNHLDVGVDGSEDVVFNAEKWL